MKFLSMFVLAGALVSAFLIGYFFPHHDVNPATTAETTAAQPRFTSATLPDFSTYTDVKLKKSDFFSFMLPRVKQANQLILQERDWIKNLQRQSNEFEQTQMNQLLQLAEKYKVKFQQPNEIIQELLIRIDTLPASLVLAQAANESAWATSRFAVQGNNLFGQWCYVKGCGLIPRGRGADQHHEVARFKNIQQSIDSYMRNLNTQAAYTDLRGLRQDMREDNSTVSGLQLAKGLLKYSTRREAYVEEIQAMIRQNRLGQYDK